MGQPRLLEQEHGLAPGVRAHLPPARLGFRAAIAVAQFFARGTVIFQAEACARRFVEILDDEVKRAADLVRRQLDPEVQIVRTRSVACSRPHARTARAEHVFRDPVGAAQDPQRRGFDNLSRSLPGGERGGIGRRGGEARTGGQDQPQGVEQRDSHRMVSRGGKVHYSVPGCWCSGGRKRSHVKAQRRKARGGMRRWSSDPQ